VPRDWTVTWINTKITELLREFKQRFQIFGQLKTNFQVFRSPFTVNPSDLPVDWQLEIIDLQCDSDLKTKFVLASLDTFYQYLLPAYPKVTSLATKVLCMFGTTYLCEQVFSVMNINKTELCSWPTQAHLCDILKVAAAQDLTPDVDTLVELQGAKFQA